MSKSKNRNRSGQREASHFANLLHDRVQPRLSPIRVVSDLRLYRPDVFQDAQDGQGRPARLKRMVSSVTPAKPAGRASRARPALFSASEHYAFAAPASVMVCVRRKMRREVLHALKRTRSGAGKPRRRNRFSDVRC